MGTYPDDYGSLLVDIDNELHVSDIKKLKFLCSSSIKKKFLTDFQSGLELFEALEKCNLLSPIKKDYLTDLLHIIGRVDLALKVDQDRGFQDPLQLGDCMLSRFHVLLFHLSEDMGSEDVNSLRFLYNKVPKSTVIEEGIDLFTIMLNHAAISPQRLEPVIRMLKEIQRNDLVIEVDKYLEGQEKCASQKCQDCNIIEYTPVLQSEDYQQSVAHVQPEDHGHEAMEDEMSQGELMEKAQSYLEPGYTESILGQPVTYPASEPASLQHSGSNEDLRQSISMRPPEYGNAELYRYNEVTALEATVDSMSLGATAARMVATPAVMEPVVEPLASLIDSPPVYRMDASPKGICLIIDNREFNYDPQDREATLLYNREGSHIDYEALKRTFTDLDFIVLDDCINMSDTEMYRKLADISRLNHVAYDCFVCCILSHGGMADGRGYIFGVNGHKLYINDMTSLFRPQSCPSLAGKPKLFFMQCCLGKTHQIGVNPTQFDVEHDSPQREDCVNWVGNEADFLFGYATVPNHVSYRSRSRGAFYINELTHVLDTYARRGEDLLTMLTRVNHRVSQRIHRETMNGIESVVKQVPAPQTTLTKHVKFA